MRVSENIISASAAMILIMNMMTAGADCGCGGYDDVSYRPMQMPDEHDILLDRFVEKRERTLCVFGTELDRLIESKRRRLMGDQMIWADFLDSEYVYLVGMSGSEHLLAGFAGTVGFGGIREHDVMIMLCLEHMERNIAGRLNTFYGYMGPRWDRDT